MRSFVFCLGLYPALQRTLVFDAIELGRVNRAVERRVSAGGKAVNTAAALERLGTHACAAGFNGGASGRVVTRLLRAQGIGLGLTPTAAETRTCTTLLDRRTGGVTELIEEGPALAPAERKAFVRAAHQRIAACRALALCGNLPPGVEPGFYVAFAKAARRAGRPVVIDSHRDPLLAVLPQRPLLAKLNAHELALTLACRCDSERQVWDAARRLREHGARWALVTRGGAPAILVGPDDASWRITPPAIKPLNPIGSGDCVTAGILHACLDGASMPDAVRAGMACGAANALTAVPASFSLPVVRRMHRLTRLTRLHLKERTIGA